MTTSPSNTQSRFGFPDVGPVARLVTVETESPRGLVDGTDRLLIGKRLRHRRKQRGLTLEAVAERAGLSASAVSLIETGKREAKISTLIGLAAALDCQLAELLSSAPPSRRQRWAADGASATLCGLRPRQGRSRPHRTPPPS